MADTTVATEYRRIRKEHPRLASSQAILWARGNAKPTTLDWTVNFGEDFATGTGTKDGFDIVATAQYDPYPDYRVTPTDDDTGIRNPDFRWTGDEYGSRGTKRFLSLESDSTVRELAPEYHRTGDAKNVAWERARTSLQEEAEQYLSDDYVQLIFTVKVSIKGQVLGEATIGSDIVIDYRRLEKELDDIVSECALVEEAIDEARVNAPMAIVATQGLLDSLQEIVLQGA